MSPHESDRRHIERQIAYARPIIVLLALIALFQQTSTHYARRPIYFLIAYFFLSVFALLFEQMLDRKSTRLNSSHANISYAVFCLKKKKKIDYCVLYTIHTDST